MKSEVYPLPLSSIFYNCANRLLSRLTFPSPYLLPTLSFTHKKEKRKRKRKCDKTHRHLK